MAAIIAPQTAAAQSDRFDIDTTRPVTPAAFEQGNFPLGTTFRITGGALGAGEYVVMEYLDGTDWRVANQEGDAGKVLDENNAIHTVYGRMTGMRLNKSGTASALGVEAV